LCCVQAEVGWTHLSAHHTALLSIQQDVEYRGPQATWNVLATLRQHHTPSL